MTAPRFDSPNSVKAALTLNRRTRRSRPRVENDDYGAFVRRALEQLSPIADVGIGRAEVSGAVWRTKILGGLINEYRHAA
jgi:hypothetical protein